MSGLRARHRARSEGPTPVPDPPKALGVKAHDFADLPQLAEFRMMEAALQRFDLANPFFRSHRGKPQPEQEVEGRPVINFASYNYLGLNGDPRVTEAARAAISEWGVSPAASRVVGGERPYHRELEQALAASHGAEDAIVLDSGHATNVNAIATLMGEDDLVVLDALSHNSIIQGVKLSGA
ncbi:MAG: aminotransferase class I/II-fold pyridoxal phosphate-dependent enzyme, partial [Pseudomonadota bacterium]